MSKYLNLDGLGTFWDKIKSTFVKKNDNGYVDKSQIPVKTYRASGSRAYVRICRCQAPTSSTSPTIDCNIRMGDATVRVIIQGYNEWRANVMGYLNSTSFKFYAHPVVVGEVTFYDIIAYHTTYCRGFYSPQFLYDYDSVDFSYWAAPYTEYTPTDAEEIPYIMLAKSTASSSNAPVKVNAYGDLSPITVDGSPTAGHTANLVSSDGIKAALDLKQDLLSEQTAYSAKGTATKVPQITTNNLGQVTKIEEKTISGVAPASHTHGNIANGGTLTDTAAAAAGNDYVVIRDADNAKIQTSTIKGTDVADAVSKKHSHSTLTLSTTAQAYDGSHTLALPSTDPYTSARTPASHSHGNIQNGGTLQTTDITIANGDKLVVTDSSNSSKIARTSLSFDGSTTTTALTPKGTFEPFAKAGDIPPAVSVKGNAESSYRTGQVNLTPADLGISATTTSVTVGSTTCENTDTKVTQTKDDSGTTAYPLLMAGETNPNGSATTSRYDSNVKLTPSTNTISANISGNAATADAATNVNLTGDVKATSTTNGDTIRVKAGSGTAAEITIINAKHAASANTATNSINSAVAADTEHKLYIIGATGLSGWQALKTDDGIYATTESGELHATKFDVNGGCTLQYNSTTKSLDFVFG